MMKHKNKITAGVIIAVILTIAFWFGGNTPGVRELSPAPESEISAGEDINPQSEDEPFAKVSEKEQAVMPPHQETITNVVTEKDQYQTKPAAEVNPIPIEPENAVIADEEFTCTLTIRCDTILNNLSMLDERKFEILPEDGIIFKEKTVSFYEGESVFNLLVREMKRNKIHMEFTNTPIYNSAYIEGIANLYEFDCGELSGWMYKVNNWFPNYGCSRYQLKDGDRVEWVYTCDLGKDVGGYYSARNGN